MKAMGRTVVLIVWLSAVMVISLLICAHYGQLGTSMFPSVCALLGALGAVQGGKSAYEASSTQKGRKGDPS